MEHYIKHRPERDIRTADGFAGAVKQMERLLFAVSFSVLGNSDACADAVQNALLKAWEKRQSLHDAASFRSWLVRIVRNESKNYLRQRPALPLDADIPYSEEPAARLDVKRALAKLPDKSRLVAMLYYFERCTVSEIAELLKLPEGTVHSRLSRARECLRKELPDYESNR